jgi:hypothetical protein
MMFELLIALMLFVEQDAESGEWDGCSADFSDKEVEAAQDGAAPPDDREKHRDRPKLKHFLQEAEALDWADRCRNAAARLLKDGQPTVADGTWWVQAGEQRWQSKTAAGALRDAAQDLSEPVEKRERKPKRTPSGSLSL